MLHLTIVCIENIFTSYVINSQLASSNRSATSPGNLLKDPSLILNASQHKTMSGLFS